ncbi:aspartate/glutamate racemase family protein [Oceanobacillus jeddahense]|uniref:Aspartate/glutamate racemase family protein n=1 Tax=Oceanobacillus jeddahense TaxID=1462527 RepID=A0ABY5JWT3_9BACI|nr:aspartate/glutamate racemase family protein [Oceanobacillus jeddahense]UUI03882.1 aspartate/glutamate racemase family protein [Oceanobacillus jeddahense]
MRNTKENIEYGFIDNSTNSSIITQKKGQYISGYSVGILYIDNCWYPVIPGNVANLSTYDFPVRLKKVKNSQTMKILNGDPEMLDNVIKAAKELEEEGARAISSACGFFGNYQKEVADSVNIPVYLSSITQIPMIFTGLKSNNKIGILTAYEKGMTSKLFKNCGVNDSDRCVIHDMSEYPEFSVIIKNKGSFDNEKVKQEVIDAATMMINNNPDIGAILLECSDLPPYASDIQRNVGLPVYDFISLINWVHLATSQKPYHGFV